MLRMTPVVASTWLISPYGVRRSSFDRYSRIALPQPGSQGNAQGPSLGTLGTRVEAFERETIIAELRRHQNNIAKTAKALGLERSYLYKKCQQLGIDLQAMRKEE